MGTPLATASPHDLQERLEELTLRDEHRIRRRLDGIRRMRDPQAHAAALAEIAADVEAAAHRLARRRAAVPTVTYPDELPVSGRREEIMAAVRDHQVVIVAGETGSGKTTQLPKICLELGRGVRGVIGHTQPRRLAARTVAERIADELGTRLGEAVGYKVRFTDRAGDDTLVKVMTDGVLLAEIQHDRQLRRYDTLIIDEAHERSLNIDFLLGYVHQLLPRRPDLKLIITSATIDPDRFARHFRSAPVVEVSGRTYPVEVRYRPLTEPVGDSTPTVGGGAADRDQVQAIGDAVDELCAEGPGDILVFLSGEREIRDTAEHLARARAGGGARGRARADVEIVPLYARLSAAEQHRVFAPHAGRRIVLATNVAETSLTVPGIKYVIDPGTARISRYSHRTKVQRLPIEAISQASANQRKGRCGRTSDGVCVRLYTEDDFLARPEFTDPEILRTNLASVILQMAALGLGDVAAFPFIDPPDRRNIRDGVSLLHELGAFTDAKEAAEAAGAGGERAAGARGRLTDVGRRLAQLPIDPRLARMVLEAERRGCVREVTVIAAALSIQDPRERPAERREAAAQQHARFADETSDFLALLNLWNYLRDRQAELTSSQFRRMCKAEFLSYLRVREWQDLVGQLGQVLKTMDVHQNSAPGTSQAIHIALLSGLLSHIGVKDVQAGTGDRAADRRPRRDGGRRENEKGGEYLGARGARFSVFPSSALFKKPPAWVMAGELVETSRLWARVVARIEPEWAEELAQHLVRRAYSEPHWERRRAGVVAYERVTLYGVPIVTGRKTDYGRIDPETARELFIRHALVEGDWQTSHRFFHDNRRLLEDAEDLEHRVRRRDLVVDDEVLFDFYDQRIGPGVVSGRHFDSWWKTVRRDKPDLLTFTAAMLLSDEAGDVHARAYPDEWEQGALRLPLAYRFEPGSENDGVTVQVPLAVVNQVDAADFAWQVPGMREELVTALIRALPKEVRRALVPAPAMARAALDRLSPRAEPLLPALERELSALGGVDVVRGDWRLDRVPAHLRMTFAITDDHGRTLAQGKDLDALRRRLAPRTREVLTDAAREVERTGLEAWTIGTLPRTVERRGGDHAVRAFPALVDEGGTVAVRLFANPDEQRRAMAAGTRRLLLLNTPSPLRAVLAQLPDQVKLALSHHPYATITDLFDDCVRCAADHLIEEAGGPAWDEAAFTRLRRAVAADLLPATSDAVALVGRILATAHTVDSRLRGTNSLALVPSLTDIRAQLSELVRPGFVSGTGARRLPDLLRYLRAAEHRLHRLPSSPQRDRDLTARVTQLRAAYDESRATYGTPANDRAWDDIRWMLEELRVSFFAQALGTSQPVSEKRILRAMDQLRDVRE